MFSIKTQVECAYAKITNDAPEPKGGEKHLIEDEAFNEALLYF